jgi:hypothetical protein
MTWTDADAVALRAYLASESGQNLLKDLNEYRPQPEGESFEMTALNAKLGMGWDLAINFIKGAAAHNMGKKKDTEFVEVDQ